MVALSCSSPICMGDTSQGVHKGFRSFYLVMPLDKQSRPGPPADIVRNGAIERNYDIVVVGGGHAGSEAATAAARLGLRTALATLNLDLIAQMSCNPAIGGIAKGHLVREIDALGGIMGEMADATGIQFRLLNTSRGPAVWSPRAQCDKKLYRFEMRKRLEQEPNLVIKQAEAIDLVLEQDRVVGLRLADGRVLGAKAVVITTGTFLNGLIHVGEATYPSGRSGETGIAAPRRGAATARLSLRAAQDRHAAAPGRPHQLTGTSSSHNPATRNRLRSPFAPKRSSASKSSATSATRPTKRTACSRTTSNARRSIADKSKASDHATALQSKTRSSSSPTSPATRFF